MSNFPLLAGALLMLGAAPALAQDAGAPAMSPPAVGGPMAPLPRPPRWGEGGGAERMALHRQFMEMMTKSAFFRFKRGDSEIDIKCAADESTKACVDAASALIDKVNAGVPH